MTDGRRIAITGASGYIARRLIRRLESNDGVDHILAVDRRLTNVGRLDKVEFEQLDIRAPFPRLFVDREIDAVVHLAYVLNPGHHGPYAHQVNVVGTQRVLEACANAGAAQVIYFSSTSVYGARADNPEFLTETDPVRPLRGFQYSEDKAEAEALLERYAKDCPSTAVAILRGCPVMGPNADNFIANAFQKPILPAIGRSDPSMQFLHEDDATEVMVQFLEQGRGGTYNVAADGTITWSEMADVMGRKLLRLPAPIWRGMTASAWYLRLQRESPPVGLNFIRHRWTANADKLKRELNMEFRYTSREAWTAFATKDRAWPQKC